MHEIDETTPHTLAIECVAFLKEEYATEKFPIKTLTSNELERFLDSSDMLAIVTLVVKVARSDAV